LDRLGRPGSPEVRPEIIVDQRFSDDAAIVQTSAGRDLVLTADVIAPLVDDPETFGAIAAANSLSDVWAMGGEPRFALNLVFFPDDQLPLEVLDAILEGSARLCAQAGVAVVGGHSVRDSEVKFGLSVTGDVEPGRLWSNRTAEPGQVLVLTKALGTGVVGQAIKKGIASAEASEAAIASMTLLNQRAATIGHRHGVTAATDVTGFGLLGHLFNVVRGSNVAAEIDLESLVLLPEALTYLRAQLCPGGSKSNRAYLAPHVAWGSGAPLAAEGDNSDRELLASLACDAQTSGGLLLCVPEGQASDCVAELRSSGVIAAAIGRLIAPRHGAPIVLR
jgi:selenide,water dikinase